ncbi:GNAT family N-acetyltransferase [Pediococcus inopinatus]|uniref:GNAT family N-acetyltransferase n=1 Tax=Pediococcus inopinatus TaxID=114090 RepID=A0ABZ0Q3P1_9LACO|nr:GNAT family N-acetyltransferase [Pediococcus inopinatus]AVL00696.1 GNAT family N-acetyltransferase [Pediococcus inopinatus]KRN63090.1 acetyltransferase, GNAT family [Pediococcus inopinatus]WPC19890.1 GNAT family N-acetyltransferase [Pediococcus inopinatus]WPC21590.1 GNAT family N-acetyltransferase [Pediococcus inopinatus]WPP09476.1 GNAT family N-acetyltransferase [Pediococcus inopinatus]
MEVTVKEFSQLSNLELFQIYKLRTQVFVVEQLCAYQEVDDADLIAQHLQVLNEDQQLVSYLRIIPETDKTIVHIGRVVVDPRFRKHGYGRQLIVSGLQTIQRDMPQVTTVKIQAQAYLQTFYQSFGFKPVSEVYLDTGIPHLDMVLDL